MSRVGYSRAFEICASGRFVEADEAVQLGIALAKVPADRWDAHAEALLAPMLSALPDAVGELKGLLAGAVSSADQAARERAAQTRRLRALRRMMGSS